MKKPRPQCSTIMKRVGKYAICGLVAGHASAHWDQELRISWNSREVAEPKQNDSNLAVSDGAALHP